MKKILSCVVGILLLTSCLAMAVNIQSAECAEPPETEWTRAYGATEEERARCVVQTFDGGFAIVGFTMSLGAGGDFWLIKTDSAGNEQWNRTYGGPDNDRLRSMVQTTDGGYALGGWTRSFGAGDFDFWLIKTDVSGNMLWNKTYGGANYETAFSVVQTFDGGYAIAGPTMSFGAGSYDFWLVKTDSVGDIQWDKTYGGLGWDWAWSVVQTFDGGYAIAGWTDSFGAGNEDMWLIKAASEVSWEYVFEDTCRDTVFKISTDDGYFQFITPDKMFPVKQDENMYICRNTIIIWYGDGEMTLFAMINTRYDYCFAIAYDKMSRETYLLIDRLGIE